MVLPGLYSRSVQQEPEFNDVYAVDSVRRMTCIRKDIETETVCPDPEVKYILYSEGQRQVLDTNQEKWLSSTYFNYAKETVLLIHGYTGGDGKLPMVILRDGKLFK